MLIKDEKQHLGLGDYRVLRYQAVVRHLCLVDSAYACLTHLGWRFSGPPGDFWGLILDHLVFPDPD